MIASIFLHVLVFIAGLVTVVLTFSSALSSFVLPRAAHSTLNWLVFGLVRRGIAFLHRFTRTYRQRDGIMAYYAPVGLMLLVPSWYALIAFGYTAMYWAVGAGSWAASMQLSGSSLFTLGFAPVGSFWISLMVFTEAMFGLILVALLISYLPTMYSAFSRREQAVSMLAVRAGNPPSAWNLLERFHRIQGMDNLGEFWKAWEVWFVDVEESHTTLPTLVFFRSPNGDNSWITAAGVVLDAASLTLSALDVPKEYSASLCIRAGYLCLRRVANYFDIPVPTDPHFPQDPISVTRAEFEDVLDQLAASGLPVKQDRDQAWMDYAGWRVNYDRTLLVLCTMVMAPVVPWSSDRAARFKLSPLIKLSKKNGVNVPAAK